jgi:hypothetical protein
VVRDGVNEDVTKYSIVDFANGSASIDWEEMKSPDEPSGPSALANGFTTVDDAAAYLAAQTGGNTAFSELHGTDHSVRPQGNEDRG